MVLCSSTIWNHHRITFIRPDRDFILLRFERFDKHHGTGRYYRAFAMPILGQVHVIPKSLRQKFLTAIIAFQSGDHTLFVNNHKEEFEHLSLDTLIHLSSTRYLGDTLSSTIHHLDPKIHPSHHSIITESKHRENYLMVQKYHVSNGPNRQYNLMLQPNHFDPKNSYCSNPELRLLSLNFRGAGLVIDLSLKYNRLVVVPSLTKFKNLKMLDLSRNKKIRELPTFSCLKHLRRLELSNNALTTPPIVTGLERLEMLDVSNNLLIIPPDVTGLGKLQYLTSCQQSPDNTTHYHWQQP